MKYILLFCFVCITGSVVFCQKQKLPPPSPPSEPKKIGGTKFNLQKRSSFYPFNKATQIRLVSFTERADTSSTIGDEHIWGLPMSNDTICFSKLETIKSITLKQADTLTDILYNTCYRWNMTEISVAECYLPRSAIIFFDESDKPFEYIEICFECHGIKYSNEKMEIPYICNEWYTDLKKFFRKLGIKTEATNKN